MGGSFRYSKWDFTLNIFQIICMQSLFYVGLCSILTVVSLSTPDILSVETIFVPQNLNFKSRRGLLLSFAFSVNTFLVGVALWRVVERSKLCLDFACTVYGCHALFCSVFTGRLPTSAAWWLLQTVCIGVGCVCGELLCVRSELAAVPVSMATRSTA